MVQALSYLVVFVLFSLDTFYVAGLTLSSMFGNDVGHLSLWTRYYHLTSRPAQGFVYFLVFVGHKVYGIRQVKSDLTIPKAIWHVLMVREEPLFYISRISLLNGDLNNVDEDEMYFVGDGEDDCEEEDAPRMYPFHEQNVVDGVDSISGGAGSDSRGELSSHWPASWFSLSTRRSESSYVAKNRRKSGLNVDEDDAISGISGKMDWQGDDMEEELDISKSADTFQDDSGVTDSDSRGILSSIGPAASWFSRSTRRSEASSIKDDNSKE